MAREQNPPQVTTAQAPPPSQPGAGAQDSLGGRGGSSQTGDRRTRADFQHILDNCGIATLVLDRDLKLLFFTPAAMPLFALTTASLARPLAEVPRHFIDDDLLTDAQTVIVTGVSLWRQVEADGGAWYNRRLMPYRVADGLIQGVIVTFADVSEMKAAEREADAARAYSNSIVDTIRQPLVVLDHELRIVSASPSFYHGFALLPVDAVGRRLPELRDHCLDVAALRSFLGRIAADRDVPEDYQIEIDLPPRGRRILQLNAREIPAVPPAKRRTLLAIDDITNRKRAESALEIAMQQAERANIGKSRFLAAASHDLRQPLQTLTLLQGILASTANDADSLRLIGRMGEALDTMSGMLNKLLDINQLEAGVVTPNLETFPIGRLFDRLRDEFMSQAESKGLSYRVVSSRRNVRSDSALIEQIIRNLFSNALKYTDHGTVMIGCRRRGDHLRIEIWDTGLGIPEGQLKAIFEEFYQLDNPARERGRGLGLGLSIVRRLADLLGHRVEVRSRPGKGSVFSIELPCAGGESVSQIAVGVGMPARRGQGESIMVIEDDPAIREMLQVLFRKNGYQVAVAPDGNAGLDLVARAPVPPDIAVADYNLPNGLSGLDVAAGLRKMLGRAFPVLIVTGEISTDTLRAVTAAGCVQLNKPVRADELLEVVRSRLDASRAAQERPPVKPAAELDPIVFLIDDDDALRDTMRDLIERAGRPVEAFASGEAFLAAYRPGRRGCLLVDAFLPGLGGLALLQRLKADDRILPSIMITGHGDVTMAVEAMKAGAIDFIEKPVGPDELLASIGRALDLTRDSMALSSWHDTAVARLAGLTPRERQIMGLVIAGQPNKIIAADLNVSQRTIESHRAAVMKKTCSNSLSDLVRLSIAAA